MFKKFKDKLAEEVKSSPQRIQQFAQAAQAAVTSASSSISDITNNDLFSIGDSDTSHKQMTREQSSNNIENTSFETSPNMQYTQQSNLPQSSSLDYISNYEGTQRQRRLSNSSLASDVSFRLPSYDSPTMYHLQSDMEVSASEADERGFSSGAVSLDRVTKEQLYSAYKKTQERYSKYRSQYADLARHYKLLEKENAKAKSVLVETQDKALRRISELKEQCSLEQGAKAHLEKALRIEIDEKNMNIEALHTKIKLLQSSSINNAVNTNITEEKTDNTTQLIDLSINNDRKQENNETTINETSLNNKIEKLEQLVNKYKESLKTSKEKNSLLTTELQILKKEVENKNKENEQLKVTAVELIEARKKVQEITELNEELQNKLNTYDFNKTKEMSVIESELQKAQETIENLNTKIEGFVKREEENAISLAENKLSIHKELENKENEIKALKEQILKIQKDLNSFININNELNKTVNILEEEKSKFNMEELTNNKLKIIELDSVITDMKKKYHNLEISKSKADEEYKCLQLQMNQETAEKLAMIDRNTYLENRNAQLIKDMELLHTKIEKFENEVQMLNSKEKCWKENPEYQKTLEELDTWKTKCSALKSEIHEEKEELINLQAVIEKLIENHKLIQSQNTDLQSKISELAAENTQLKQSYNKYRLVLKKLKEEINNMKQLVAIIYDEAKTLSSENNDLIRETKDAISKLVTFDPDNKSDELKSLKQAHEILKLSKDSLQDQLQKLSEKTELSDKDFDKYKQENEEFKNTLKEKDNIITSCQEKIKNVEEQCVEHLNELKNLQSDKIKLTALIEESNGNLRSANENYDEQLSSLEQKVKETEKEKHDLIVKIKDSENCNNTISNDLKKLEEVHEYNVKELKLLIHTSEKALENEKEVNLALNKENESINSKLVTLTNQNEILSKELEDLKIAFETISKQYSDLEQSNINDKDIIKILEKEKLDLENTMKNLHTENDRLTKELHCLKADYKDVSHKQSQHMKEEDKLRLKIKNLESKDVEIKKLEEKNKVLIREKELLKTECENMALNFEKLQIEVNDVRRSHVEIEAEKDRLIDIIDKLESKEYVFGEKEELLTKIQDLETKIAELEKDIKSLNETNDQLLNKISEQKLEMDKNENIKHEHSGSSSPEVSEKFENLNSAYDLIKEENRRLHSDIEGLQTYLTKISKENSLLNDKLRELIATSECSLDKSNVAPEAAALQIEISSSKDKIEDLIRENTLLAEENLELKDQLNSHSYMSTAVEGNNTTENEKELQTLKEKYNKLLENKHAIETKVLELEQINSSVNNDMKQMQENNTKLRFSNEKLERRLDEALVSLRHLHALQENTELEYLRNILFEYLTGPGTHSTTLAKVLAAVVKFDEKQTNMVLQKEKERQGLLRQMGLL